MVKHKLHLIILYIITLNSSIQWTMANTKQCTYEPNLTNCNSKKRHDTTPDTVFTFIPFYKATRLGNNSLYLLDQDCQILSCMNADELAQKLHVDMNGQIEYAIFTASIYQDNIILAIVQKFMFSSAVYLNDFYFIFLDMNLNLIPSSL